MPVFSIIHGSNEEDLSGVYVDRSLCGTRVCVTSVANYLDPINCGSSTAVIDVEDIPALCAELRRVAKLAKQGGQDGTR
jgi:hypothetical protein